jgi:SpoVK/Ycf46/Vps4 family AAA+-type ATPase
MTILTKLIEAGAKILDKRTTENKKSIFDEIVGYSDIKKEFAKALDASSPVGILLCGPPGCGKSEFLKQIRNHCEKESVFIVGLLSEVRQAYSKYCMILGPSMSCWMK